MHTQGEWITNGGLVRTADENNITVRRVATIHGGFGEEEKIANAHLVAAAPALKAALIEAKKALWTGARGQWNLSDFKAWAVVQQIDAALTKADRVER